jgi:hypothetical protein
MTDHKDFFTNGIEDLPPSGINAVSRSRITDYTPTETTVIDTGTGQLESPTVQNIMAQREDNPFLRLGVIGGVMGIVGLLLWGIFAILSPQAPAEVAEETSIEAEETVEPQPDYQAQLAFRDQFHALEKKTPSEPQIEQGNVKLPPVIQPPPLPPSPRPVTPSLPLPIPHPTAPRLVSRLIPRLVPQAVAQPVRAKTESQLPPPEQWLALANFGTGISDPSISQPQTQDSPTFPTNSLPAPALLVNHPVSPGELGILKRRRDTTVMQPAIAITLDRGITRGKIELPLVWDSSLKPEQQQANQLTVILEEPIYDPKGKVIFDRGSLAIVEVQSINDANGLVTAYVSQINDTTFDPGELILRNQKKSALVAKASKRSNFGNQLLVGGVDTLSSFGQQILIPETNSTLSNGSAIVTSQSRNSIGRDLAGSALDGFGSSLSNELEQSNSRNQIGDGGTIFTLAQNTTVYLTNIQPLKINP